METLRHRSLSGRLEVAGGSGGGVHRAGCRVSCKLAFAQCAYHLKTSRLMNNMCIFRGVQNLGCERGATVRLHLGRVTNSESLTLECSKIERPVSGEWMLDLDG